MPAGKAPQITPRSMTDAQKAISDQTQAAQDQLDNYAGAVESTIDTFNLSKSQIGILTNNSGSSSQSSPYYDLTATIPNNSNIPLYVGIAVAAYFLIGKGKLNGIL